MQGRNQFPNLFLNIISRAATAALAITVVFALTVVLSQSAQAQKPATGRAWTEHVLHSFGSGTEGTGPTAGLISDAAGNLYGTTSDGGTSTNCPPIGCGTVFKLTPAAGGGWTETALHNFGNYTDGATPMASLIFDAHGNLYGTTEYGGTYNDGTVFELTPTAGGGWTEQVLHTFGSGDGAAPMASLIFDADGNLYGTTSLFGTSLYGTVFELTPTGGGGWRETVLYNFCAQTNCTDGAEPYAGVIFDAAGNLYGTTLGGGVAGYGTVFELTPTRGGGWTETVLHSFNLNGTDGTFPYAGLIFDGAGNLYGTTSQGGGYYYYGEVFELTPTGGGSWAETVLYSFCPQRGNCTDGANPQAGLTRDAAGNLYGTTYAGGTYNCKLGCGTVFELRPTAGGSWTETVLHNFNDNGTDGYRPYASLVFDAHGSLYGTTQYGGAYDYGTAFELTPPHPCATCSHAVIP